MHRRRQKSPVPAMVCDGTPEEHARHIIEVMVADNPVGRRVA